MRPPVWACVVAILGREALRAAAFPLHLALDLLASQRWRACAASALAATPATTATADLAAVAPPLRRRHHVFLSAGEASGEAHATDLLAAARRQGVDARWSCFGGNQLVQAGGQLLAPLSEHAIIGVAGVVRTLPFLLGVVARFVRLLRDDPPDLVVLVDYPGLHLVLGRLARRHGIPVLHYIAPQYWAWAPWRLHRYRRCVDRTLTILPFEPAFFAAVGVPSTFVGNPLLDRLPQSRPAAATTAPLLCLLPGSRRSEIEANVGPFVAIAKRLRAIYPDLRFVLPQVSPKRMARIRELVAANGGEFIELREGPIAASLAAARAVLAKSGTGSLEACLYLVPTVVVYRLRGWLADFARRRFLHVPWVAAANLVAGREVVPEFVFRGNIGWARAETALRNLLADGPQRAACLAGLAEVRARLGKRGASDRAAQCVRLELERAH